ncbi:hypothetical protein J4Q44_G00350150 [Coregonus suidteri]|uniref:Uncharacterized protein n=1 Tax=Coregonus suidteri TaxID=861788 RepID=A0AAN8Q7N2_9TELE
MGTPTVVQVQLSVYIGCCNRSPAVEQKRFMVPALLPLQVKNLYSVSSEVNNPSDMKNMEFGEWAHLTIQTQALTYQKGSTNIRQQTAEDHSDMMMQAYCNITAGRVG